MTDSVTSIGCFLRRAGWRCGLPVGVVALIAAAAVAAADEPPRAAPAQVMSWVAPYNWQQCEAMLKRDLGGVEMGDALTHLALQFWRPDPATGAVVYVDHEWQTPDDAVVQRFKDWAAGRDVELLLCAYNNDGQWNWELVGPILRDPARRAAHVAALVAEARRLGLAGVDIDYEWPGGDNRDEADFLAFVSELSAALRSENLWFFLSTFAHIWNFPNAKQWHAIAPWVDGINSMGYEEIGRAGEAWRAYASQKAGLEDPRKLLLGMPAYAGGGWLGNTVEEHIDWVIENGGVGIAIWDATLADNPAWLNPAVWRKLRGLKNPAPPAQGLRVYYDFEQTGAAGLANKAPVPGGLFQATRVGGGAFDGSANPSGPGFSGKADFNPGNGASDRSQLVAGKALNLVDTRNDAVLVLVGNRDLGSSFTIAAWHALTPSGGSVARPFVFEGSDNYNVSWGIGSGDSYTAYVTQASALGGYELTRGVWHHVAQVFQVSPDFQQITLRLYLNGALAGTRTGAANSMRFSALHIGKHRGAAFDRAWDGMLDEVAVWSRALTANEVLAIYQMGAAGLPLSATFEPVTAYRGQVFTAGAGVRVPLAGVAVSDGLHVVKTGADGRFELPGVARTRFIQATVPSGYRAVDRHFLPVRDHAGDYDFELAAHPRTAGGTVRFLQLADTETNEDTGGWIGSVRDYAANQEVGFIVHTGDLPYERGMNFHARAVNQTTMGVPVFYCVGNHDLETGAYGEEMFETRFGPAFYSFEAGNTHFVVTPMLSGTHAPSYHVTQVHEWLVNDLANKDPDKNLVVFNHFNLTTGNDFIYGPGGAQSVRLNDHRLKAWIYGHHHANYKKHHGDTGIISVQSAPPTMGGINHSTGNFLVYEMDAVGAIEIEQVHPRIDGHLVIAAPAGSQLARGPGGSLTVSANAYDGRSPVVAAAARIGAGPWQPMTRNSDWNWSLEHDPAGLVEGQAYPVAVRATRANGQVIGREGSFVYAAEPKPTAGLRLQWIRNTGGNALFGAPVVADGKVYLTAVSLFRHADNRVMAYDLETGALLWQAAPDSPVHHGLSVDAGRVLATDQEGVAYGWDAATGARVWRRDLGRSSYISHVAGGVARGGVYYTGFGNYLSALDAATGNVLWRSTAWKGGYCPPAAHALAGDTLVVGAQWSGIHGHNTASGARRWSVTANQTHDGVADGIRNRGQGAVWFDNELYVMGSNALARMNATTGARLRTDNLPYNKDVASRPFVDATRVITGTAADGLAAFDRASAAELWRVETGPALVFTSPYSRPDARTVHSEPTLSGGRLVFGASDGFLYVVDPASGATIHRFHLGAPVFGAVVAAPDGSILVADYGGSLYQFSQETASATKAANSLNLDQGASWLGGVAPDAGVVAVFNGEFPGGGALDTGSPLEVAGLRVTSGTAPVVIDNMAALAVGGLGIDMAHATRDLLVSRLTAAARQPWIVAPGRMLGLGGVDGGAEVTLSGGGRVVIEGADTRGGATSVLAATTLEIGAGGSVAGAISNHGTAVFNRSGDFSYAGAIAGAGGLVKRGAGRLTLSAVQPFTGDTVVNAGTLALTGGSPGSGQHRLNSGTLFINDGATFSFNGTAQFGWAAGTPKVVMDGGRITTTNRLDSHFHFTPDTVEGLGSDGIYQFHRANGRQIHMGGYGVDWLGRVLNTRRYGSPWALTPEQYRRLAMMVLAYEWLHYRGAVTFTANGRHNTHAGSTARLEGFLAGLAGLPDAALPPDTRREVAAALERVRRRDQESLEGNRFFFRNLHMVHRRAAWFIDVKMNAPLVAGPETFAGAFPWNMAFGDGVTTLLREGVEYRKIHRNLPNPTYSAMRSWQDGAFTARDLSLWHYRALPGTTMLDDEAHAPDRYRAGGGDRAGGVFDGRLGHAAFHFVNRATGNEARKLFAFTEDGMAVLACGVTALRQNLPAGVTLRSTLNQCDGRGPVRIRATGGHQKSIAADAPDTRLRLPLDRTYPVEHAGIAYLVLPTGSEAGPGLPGTLCLDFAVRTPLDPLPGPPLPEATAEAIRNHIPPKRKARVFHLWIDHGPAARDATAAWLVHMDGKADAGWLQEAPVEILSNNPALQAVRDRRDGVVHALFHQPGRLESGGALLVETPAPASLMWNPATRQLTAQDPLAACTRDLKAMADSLEPTLGPGLAGITRATRLAIPLPGADDPDDRYRGTPARATLPATP